MILLPLPTGGEGLKTKSRMADAQVWAVEMTSCLMVQLYFCKVKRDLDI